MKTFRCCLLSVIMPSLIYAFSSAVCAQNYPVKPVRYLVPYEAGGGNDVMARIIAAGLSQVLRQQVIVENRPGAGGNIGTEFAAKAPADGYTLLQISATNTVNVNLHRNLRYDLVRDFSPVTLLASFPTVFLVHPSLPVKSVTEFIKLAKAKPGAINYSSGGTGTGSFFAAELLKIHAGIDLVQVPYRGGGEALTGVLSGETSVYFPPLAVALPHIRSGKLRALALTSRKRLTLLPDIPTVAEAGYPDYESVNWNGLMVPAKTPKETAAAIHSAVISVLNEPGVNKRLVDMYYIIVGNKPEEFAGFINSEIATFAKIIKQTGISAN